MDPESNHASFLVPRMANLLCTKYFFQNTINNIFIYLLAPFIVENIWKNHQTEIFWEKVRKQHILDLLPYFIV